MRRALLILALVLVALLTDSARAAGPQTIAIGGLEVDRSLARIRPRARAIFDPLIERRVAAASYRVIPATTTEAVWNELRDSIGGYYDTYTGRIVGEKFKIVYEGTRRRLLEQHGAEAWLQPSLDVVRIGFGGGRAEWHGAHEETGGRGGLSGFLVGRSTGTLTALSLAARVESTRDGALLYGRYGGVQLLAKVVGGDLFQIDPDSLLRDTRRNEGAVMLALDSLAVRWPAN